MKERLKTAVMLLVRLALGGVLFYAGFAKLRSGYQFAEAIANFQMLPAQPNQIMAVVLPWVEVAVGLLLVFGLWARAAGILAALMFSAFLVAVSVALVRGLDIECGCFGTGSASRVGFHALAFDLAWLAASVAVLCATPPDKVAASAAAQPRVTN